MKISIRSNVVKDLREILKPGSQKVNFCFRLGRLTRDGFLPGISPWQQKNIREGLEKLGIMETEIPLRSGFKAIYTIGDVFGHGLGLGQMSESKAPSRCYDVNASVGPECYIQFVYSSIQVEIKGDVKDMNTLFNPMKFIYGLMKPVLSPCTELGREPTSEEYGKWTPVQLLAQKEADVNWVIAPLPSSGERGILYVCRTGTYLRLLEKELPSSSSTTNEEYNINDMTPSASREVSVFHGYWDEEIFTICIPVIIGGKCVRRYNISHRLALAKRETLGLAYCRVTKIFSTSKPTQESIINRYGGVMYISRKSRKVTALDLQLEVYRRVNRLSLFFKVTRKFSSGLSFFELSDGSGVFTGSKDFPYHAPISLSREDRDFINQFSPSSIMEFRWENDNLVPYSNSRRGSLPDSNKLEWDLLHHTKDLFKNTEPSPKAPMMANQRNTLKMLPVNKSVVFYSPVEGEDVLVRTGTIGEGSCLFHALLHAYSKDYATMDRKGRMKFVIRLRASMAGKVDSESWEEMGGGVISKVPYQENVREILDNFYQFVQDGGRVRGRSTRRVVKKLTKNGELNDVYKVLTELVSFKTLTSTCLPRGYDRTQDEKIDQTNIVVCEEVLEHLRGLKEMKQLGDKKAAYIEKKMHDLMSLVLDESKNAAYRSYIKGLERVSEDVDSYTIEFISDRFNRDVYFLDGTSRLPYNTCPTTANLKDRKSMVVLWVGGNHYEIVGRLLPGNRIQREFPADDELINRIRTFLTKPEKISELYPDLVEYLPRSYRSNSPRRRGTRGTTRDTGDSKDEDDSASDHYYDSSDHDSESDSDEGGDSE